METGVCYYPEHWDKKLWHSDAKAMKRLGITWVRIGEFAWSLLEPTDNQFDFDWLDEAVVTLGSAGLKVVLGTPTACPPRWMVDACPDLLAYDKYGHHRNFGSRRHYCFSSLSFIRYADRIVTKLGERYGVNKYICAWQTDNEYGCHDTVLSYSPGALRAFQKWLENKYQSIEKLNECWGNVFWSMQYRSFSDVGLPNLTVTEPNPSHHLDFRRFSSDQVVRFNKRQVDIIKKYSAMPIIHNYMGMYTDFDHYEVSKNLAIASWDSYPLGFLSQRSSIFESTAVTHKRKEKFLRQGDPDFQAFHHDLYRSVGNGNLWIMEQQPGPVNWGKYNPQPVKGMVKLWSWEAFAHGASVVSYFRWRQSLFAQEQMHTGLLTPSSESNHGFYEVEKVNKELASLKSLIAVSKSRSKITSNSGVESSIAKVAIVFDYNSEWARKVQPMNEGFSYFEYIMSLYRILRRFGLEVDFMNSSVPRFTSYEVVFIPFLFSWNDQLLKAVKKNQQKKAGEKTILVLGPGLGAGAKDGCFKIPLSLPPVSDESILNLKVLNVDTYPLSSPVGCYQGKKQIGNIILYREEVVVRNQQSRDDKVKFIFKDKFGTPALVKQDVHYYLTGCGDKDLLHRVVKTVLKSTTHLKSYGEVNLPEGVSTRMFVHYPGIRFIGNYGEGKVVVDDVIKKLHHKGTNKTAKKYTLLVGKKNLNVGECAVVHIS